MIPDGRIKIEARPRRERDLFGIPCVRRTKNARRSSRWRRSSHTRACRSLLCIARET